MNIPAAVLLLPAPPPLSPDQLRRRQRVRARELRRGGLSVSEIGRAMQLAATAVRDLIEGKP